MSLNTIQFSISLFDTLDDVCLERIGSDSLPVFDCGNGGSITNSTYPMEKRYKARMIGGSVSEEFFAQGLCLPSGTAMTDYDMDRVIEIILKCRK